MIAPAWFRRRAVAGLCLLALAAGCTSPRPASDLEPVGEHRELVEAAARAVGVAPRLGDVWPGFEPRDRALLFYEDGQAILVSRERPPEPWAPVAPEALPPQLKNQSYLSNGALPGLSGNFDTDYPVGDVSAAAVALQAEGFGTLATLFHELFHEYQQDHFTPTMGAGDLESQEERFLSSSSISGADFVAMAEVERRILLDALAARETEEAAALAYAYLAVRKARLSVALPRVRAAELNIERKEGSAHLVGLEAAALATGEGLDRVVRELRANLSMAFDSTSTGASAYTRFRFRLYGTGSAIGHILDRLGVFWRGRMEEGASFYDLLARALAFDSTRTASLTGRALARYGFVEIRKRLPERMAEPTAEEAVAAFLELDRVALVLDVRETDNRLRFEASGDFPSQPTPELFLHPEAAVVSVTAPKLELSAERHPVMIDVRAAPAIARVTVMLPTHPTTEGSALPSGLSTWPHGLELTAERFRLRIARRATLYFSGDSLTVEVGP